MARLNTNDKIDGASNPFLMRRERMMVLFYLHPRTKTPDPRPPIPSPFPLIHSSLLVLSLTLVHSGSMVLFVNLVHSCGLVLFHPMVHT